MGKKDQIRGAKCQGSLNQGTRTVEFQRALETASLNWIYDMRSFQSTTVRPCHCACRLDSLATVQRSWKPTLQFHGPTVAFLNVLRKRLGLLVGSTVWPFQSVILPERNRLIISLAFHIRAPRLSEYPTLHDCMTFMTL